MQYTLTIYTVDGGCLSASGEMDKLQEVVTNIRFFASRNMLYEVQEDVYVNPMHITRLVISH